MAEKIQIGELVYKVTGDASGLKAALKDVELQADKSGKRVDKGFGSTVKGMLASVGAAIAGSKIFSFFQDTVRAASDAEETANKFGVVFKNVIGDANKFAEEIAKNYGLARTESKKLLSDTGDLLTGFGFTQEEALKLSNRVTRLGTDLASFTNVQGGAAFAVDGLRKALLGEAEQAKSLGIVINQNSKEYKDLVKRYTDVEGKTLLQAKAYAALELATKQSTNAIGDFARSATSYANQQRIINARIVDLKENIGNKLLPTLRLYQQDIINAANEEKNLGAGLGEFVSKALLSFRIANDGVKKMVAEFSRATLKIIFDAQAGVAKLASRLGLEKISTVLTKGAIDTWAAWNIANDSVVKHNKRLDESLKTWKEIGKEQKTTGQNNKNTTNELGKAEKKARDLVKAYQDSKKASLEMFNVIKGVGGELINLLSAAQALTSALYQQRIDQLDAQMEAELRAAGVAEETTVEQAQKEYDLAVATGDALTIEEKRKALEKAKIEEKYQKQKSKLEYDAAVANWGFQLAIATAQVPLAVVNALASGWAAGPVMGPILAPLYAGLAGAAGALQVAAVAAAKPQPPKFATGGIVPGNSFTGDNVPAMVNSGEMILNSAQQRQLFDMANGAGGGGGQSVNLMIDGESIGKVFYRLSQNGDLLIDQGAITTK